MAGLKLISEGFNIQGKIFGIVANFLDFWRKQRVEMAFQVKKIKIKKGKDVEE